MTAGSTANLIREPDNAGHASAIQSIAEPGSAAPGSRTNLGARVFQNAAANVAGRVLALLFSVGATMVLARFLGSERLGQFGAIYAYLALFGWMATFGFEPVLLREISRERDSASSLLHTAMVLSAFLSIGTVAAAVLIAPKAGYAGHLRALVILAGLEYVLNPWRLSAVIFQADMRQWYSATINVVRQGFWFAVIVALWLAGASLAYVIAGRVAAAGVETWLLWVYSRRFLSRSGRFLRERAGLLLSHSFPIAFTSLLSMIYLRIDQVMLHRMVSDSVLGQYVAAVKVSELFELLPSALMFSLAPVLSVAVAEPERLRSYTDRAFRYFMVVACGLCVVMTLGARIVVRLMYGSQFLPAAPLLAVLIWSEIAVFFAAVIITTLITSNQQHLLPIPTLVGAAINVALNLVLIPRYAAAGAAWATVASYSVAWTLTLLCFRQTRSITWQGLRFAVPLTAIGLAASACGALLPASRVAGLLVGLAAFAGGVWLTGCLRKSDLGYVSGMVRESLAKVSA